MTMVCQICNRGNSERLEIDRALAEGKSYQMLANKYGVDWQALRRHKLNHLHPRLVAAVEKKGFLESTAILERLERSLAMVEEIMRRNFEKHNDMVALAASREVRGVFETLAKFSDSLLEIKRLEIKIQDKQAQEARRADALNFSDFTVEELRVIKQAWMRKKDYDTPACECQPPKTPPPKRVQPQRHPLSKPQNTS